VRLDILKTDGLVEGVNESVQRYALLHLDQLFEWVFHLLTIDFYYIFSTNETLTYLVSYEYQPVALANLLLPMIVAPPLVADHFSKLTCV
jgi:hypothetical protein